MMFFKIYRNMRYIDKIRSSRHLLFTSNKNFLTSSVRNVAAWNRDWKPGPYPKTQAEREAAAKKYGLHPKDYEPYPDDGTGYGDYPKLKLVSAESRDGHEYYDYPEFKRNYGEPLHVNFEWITQERIDLSKKYRIPLETQLFVFLAVIFGCFGVHYLMKDIRLYKPIMPPQMPEDGKKHYTFNKTS